MKKRTPMRLNWRRKLINKVTLSLIVGCAFLAFLPLLFVFYYVLYRGFPSVNLNFFTNLPAPVGETGGGMANALLGSLKLVGLAGTIGIPIGVLCGVYLSEYNSGRIAITLRFAIDLLASVPSIIIGLFIYTIIVAPMKSFSALAGAAALAILMLPIVAKTTEEVLKLIPRHVREAGLALGIPRWRVIISIVLKGSLGAVTTGIMLAIARVAGETAPLLFTAFGNSYWAQNLSSPTASLPVQIYNYAISPYEEWHNQAWAGALILVMMVFFLNLITRFFMRKTTRDIR